MFHYPDFLLLLVLVRMASFKPSMVVHTSNSSNYPIVLGTMDLLLNKNYLLNCSSKKWEDTEFEASLGYTA
jgi:hypothetical protein